MFAEQASSPPIAQEIARIGVRGDKRARLRSSIGLANFIDFINFHPTFHAGLDPLESLSVQPSSKGTGQVDKNG